MPTTSNFGWTTPADTDLVKDGAAAIRTLGNSIDTSMMDLKGGTTGQVLAKNSNTDMDFIWTADASGIPATIFDAKGDLIAASAADTAARLAVGTNGQILTADSTTATGLKWATPATPTPTFIGCALYSASAISVANGTFQTINWDSEFFDTNGFHSTSSNTSRFTIPSGYAGKYLISANLTFASNSTGTRDMIWYLNGVSTGQFLYGANAGSRPTTISGSTVLNLAVGDYIYIAAYQTSGGSLNLNYGSDAYQTAFYLTYLGV